MTEPDQHRPMARLSRSKSVQEALGLLGSDLSGSDTTSLLMDVMAQRAAFLGPSDVLAQYKRDRFVAPAQVSPLVLAKVQLRALEYFGADYQPVECSPLVPLGMHSSVAGVSQNNLVSTVRMTEVAADPTTQLALEAAVRRSAILSTNAKSPELVRLCAVDRIVRAQVFDRARSFAHFSLLGLVCAGRDRGNRRFEADSLAGLLAAMSGFVSDALGATPHIALTDFSGELSPVMDETVERLSGDVQLSIDPNRPNGHAYYEHICFKVSIESGGEVIELGDGGFVNWTASLLQSKKERLLTGGISIERLAML